MSHPEPKGLASVEKLIQNFKYDEALETLDDLVQLEEHNIQLKFSYQFQKGEILLWQGNYDEVIKLGEQIFKENPNR